MGARRAPNSPSSGRRASTSIGCTTAPCCPRIVEFKELGTNYGFDDHTDRSVPWKSVEIGSTDTVKAVLAPPGSAANVSFVSGDTSKVTVTPGTASVDEQTVTVAGVTNGESEVQAQCGGAILGKMKVKAYTKKTKTVAVRLIHETSYGSTDVSDATITSFLAKVYNQAVFEFRLTRLPAMTVAFDRDGDGKLDVTNWMTEEMRIIRDACKDDTYDYNIFLVGNFTIPTGFMDFNQRYGYVDSVVSAKPESTLAHELGHGAFGLIHANGDPDNIMYGNSSMAKWRLRKDQWDMINR